MRPAARESDNLYIVGEEAEPGPNPHTRLSLDAIRAPGFFGRFKPGGPRRRKDVRLYILGEQAEPGPNPHTRLSLDAIRAPGFFEGSSQAARGGGKLSVFISEESRLSLDPIRAPG